MDGAYAGAFPQQSVHHPRDSGLGTRDSGGFCQLRCITLTRYSEALSARPQAKAEYLIDREQAKSSRFALCVTDSCQNQV